MVAAVAGIACLIIPAAKRWQQPWQWRRRPGSGEVGEQPAGLRLGNRIRCQQVAATVATAAVTGEREGGRAADDNVVSATAAGRYGGGGRLYSLATNGSRNH